MNDVSAAEVFRFVPACEPRRAVVVSIPHAGTVVPDEVRRAFRTPAQARLPMTDWHLGRLYDFLPTLGVAVLEARTSRYVVDLNRDPEGRALYPGRFETGLVPLTDFAGEEIWRTPPDAAEIARRRRAVFDPYHARLVLALEEARDPKGHVLLLDLHSVASAPNRIAAALAEDIFLGDRDGATAPAVVPETFARAYARKGLKAVRNRPYKGGYITAHYGTWLGVSSLQIEMAERVYMDEEQPESLDEERFATARALLRDVFAESLDRLAPRGGALAFEGRREGSGSTN
jgi:N-formylglutamate amidohydrolase